MVEKRGVGESGYKEEISVVAKKKKKTVAELEEKPDKNPTKWKIASISTPASIMQI